MLVCQNNTAMAMSFEEIKELLQEKTRKSEFEELEGDRGDLWGEVKMVKQEGGEGEAQKETPGGVAHHPPASPLLAEGSLTS